MLQSVYHLMVVCGGETPSVNVQDKPFVYRCETEINTSMYLASSSLCGAELKSSNTFFGDDFGVDHFSSLKDKELQYELYILLYRMCAMSWMLSMPMLLTAAVIYFCIAAFKLPIMPLFRLPNRTNLFLWTSNDIVSISVFRSFSSFPCSVPPRQHSGVLVTLLPHSMKALGSIPWWKRAFPCRVPRMCGFPLGALVSPKMKNTFHTTHLFCLL